MSFNSKSGGARQASYTSNFNSEIQLQKPGKSRRNQHKQVSGRKLGCVTLAYKQACYPLHHKVRRSKTWRHDCVLDYFTLPWGYYHRSTCRQVAERRTWNYRLIMRGNSASAMCSYHQSLHFNILCSDD